METTEQVKPKKEPTLLGKFLKEQRETKRLTVTKVAGGIGKSESYITHVELGLVQRPPDPVLSRYATTFGVAFEQLKALADRIPVEQKAPGIYRRADLVQHLRPGLTFRLTEVGRTTDGEPLFELTFRATPGPDVSGPGGAR